MTLTWGAPPTCHRLPVLSVQGSINLIKEVEGAGIALLDGKDERQSHQRLLPSGQLLQRLHLTLEASEGDLGAGWVEGRGTTHSVTTHGMVVGGVKPHLYGHALICVSNGLYP